MPDARARVLTAHASRYLQQLAKHWAHKFKVEATPREAVIELPLGRCALKASAEALEVELSEATDPAQLERFETVVADHVHRFSFGQQNRFGVGDILAQDAIRKFEHGAAQHGGAGLDENDVVVARGGAIAATGLDDRENALMLHFERLVAEAEGAENFNAAQLEPDQVVGVVDDAHLIGFRVAHADLESGGGHGFSLKAGAEDAGDWGT